jgi:chitinase
LDRPADFDEVIANLREALDTASIKDGKPYFFSITPAGNNTSSSGVADTQLDEKNAKNFDLINVQSYYANSNAGFIFCQ